MLKRGLDGPTAQEAAVAALADHQQRGGVTLAIADGELQMRRTSQFFGYTADVPTHARLFGFVLANGVWKLDAARAADAPDALRKMFDDAAKRASEAARERIQKVLDNAPRPVVDFFIEEVNNTHCEYLHEKRMNDFAAAVNRYTNRMASPPAVNVCYGDLASDDGNDMYMRHVGADYYSVPTVRLSPLQDGPAAPHGLLYTIGGSTPSLQQRPDVRTFLKALGFGYSPTKMTDRTDYMLWSRTPPVDELFNFATDVFHPWLQSRADATQQRALWNATDERAADSPAVEAGAKWAREEFARRKEAARVEQERREAEREAQRAAEEARARRAAEERERRRQEDLVAAARRLYASLDSGIPPDDDDLAFVAAEWGDQFWAKVIDTVRKPTMARDTAHSDALSEPLVDGDLARLFSKLVGAYGKGLKRVKDEYAKLGFTDIKEGAKQKIVKVESWVKTPFGAIRLYLRTQPSSNGRIVWNFAIYPRRPVAGTQHDTTLMDVIERRMVNEMCYKQRQVRDISTLIIAMNALWLNAEAKGAEWFAEIRERVVAAEISVDTRVV
jgi:hypothetical protein